MAHVKCRYQKYTCMRDLGSIEECRENGHDCHWTSELGVCRFLDEYPCYFEKTSKNVEFDGDSLYVGGKFIACLPSDDYQQYPGDAVIDSLEINGELIIKDGYYAKNGATEGD